MRDDDVPDDCTLKTGQTPECDIPSMDKVEPQTMAMRLVVNNKYRPELSVFLMLRKEARAAYARFLDCKSSLRQIERKLGKLDSAGAGRGLPRRDVFQYNAYLREARLYSAQLETLCDVLGRYGQRLDGVMGSLSFRIPTATKLALIGASSSAARRYEGASPSLHDLVLQDRLEDTSSSAQAGPLMACLQAYRGDLLTSRSLPRQAFQMHRFDLEVGTCSLKAVAGRDF
jgi:hypothetical protein